MSNSGQGGISSWFINNPVAANLLMFCIFLGGFAIIPSIPRQSFPPFPPNSISVSVSYSAGTAEVVEQCITKEIEAVISQLHGIKKYTSTTTRNGAMVIIKKKENYDLDTLLREVKMKVDRIANFPQLAEKPIIEKDIWEESIASISLWGQASQETFQRLAYVIREQLLAQPAINKVNILGLKQREISIELDESTLQAYGLSLQGIASQISQESIMDSGGTLKNDHSKITLKTDNQAHTAREFAKIPILTTPQGGRVLLGEMANVRDAYVDSLQIIRFNGHSGISLNLMDSESGDISSATHQAQEVINRLKAEGVIPETIAIKIWNDKSIYIKNRLDLLIKNGVVGMALICIILSIFLNYKLAFWVSIGVPISLAGTLIAMSDYCLGYTINELTTFGFIVALGILVDDAIVVGESIFTTREEEGENSASTIKGVKAVATPVTFGVLTTIAAFSPLIFIKGGFGQVFGNFAIVVIIALVFSLMESKLILPAHLNAVVRSNGEKKLFLINQLQQKTTKALNSFKDKIYSPFMSYLLKAPTLVCIFFICLLISTMSMVASGRVRIVFFPRIISSVLTSNVTMRQEAGDNLTIAKALDVESAIVEVNKYLQDKYKLSTLPLKVIQTMIFENSFSITVQAEKTVPFKEIVDLWKKKVGTVEGADNVNFTYSDAKLSDIDIQIKSKDVKSMQEAILMLKDALGSSPGVYNIKCSNKPDQAQLDITLKPNARNLGLSLVDLTEQIRNGFYGYEVQRFQDGNEELKVMVRYPKKDRQYIDDILNTMIRTSDGNYVQLNTVAEIKANYAPTSIERVNGSQIVSITADTNKSITSPWKTINDLKTKIFPEIVRQYPDVNVSFGGEFAEEKETKSSLSTAFYITLFAIYALLAVPLKSYLKPLYVMVVIPFGVIGAIWGHWLLDVPLSLLSFFGVIALCGIVVNDSLLLISEYSTLQSAGSDTTTAIIGASCKRMRAILLTSITTVAGLTPLLFEQSEQAQYLIPAAISMVFGVTFATIITLILIPAVLQVAANVKKVVASGPSRTN